MRVFVSNFEGASIHILTPGTGLEMKWCALKFHCHTLCSMRCADLQAIFESMKKHSCLFSLHFYKGQHCTVLNLRKFCYSGLSFLSLSAKCRAKIVFVLDAGEQ